MKYGMKRFFVILTLLTAAVLCFSEETAKSLALQASKKDDVELSISYLEKNIPSLKAAAEKRAAYVYLASILEKMGRYTQAQKNYAQAAAIAAGNAEGMPKKTTEEIVLDAVRCALCAGDSETAKSYLNSAVRNSSSEKVQAYIKLYEQWALLIDSDSVKKTGEIVAILKTYAELDSMKSVRPKILLTLWHVTGDKSWSQQLQKNFKGTPEEAVVSGKIQMQPSPFWYFVPRSGNAVPDVVNQDAKNVETARVPEGTESEGKKVSSKNDKIVRQQLGLFKEKSNAENLVNRLKEKGFTARITSEVRPSGTTYYIVAVDENKAGTIGDELRTAGFECYPVFE